MRGLAELLSIADDFYLAIENPKAHNNLPVFYINDHPLERLALRSCSRPIKVPLRCSPLSLRTPTQHNEAVETDFKIALDVRSFKLEEITVKVKDREIIIEGKHEERNEDENGFISRQFTRRHILPDEYDPNTITTHLNAEGTTMTIRALKAIPIENRERIIPIKTAVSDEHKEDAITLKMKKDSNESMEAAKDENEGK